MEGKIFSWDFLMTSLFRFFFFYGRSILVLQKKLSVPPSSYSILILYVFLLKYYFDSESWIKKFGWTGEKKNIPTCHFHNIIIYLPFSQTQYNEFFYNHIQNFERKKNHSGTSPENTNVKEYDFCRVWKKNMSKKNTAPFKVNSQYHIICH